MTQREEPGFSGEWPNGAQWNLLVADRLPDPTLCTTVAGVVLRNFDSTVSTEDVEVVLTYNTSGRGTDTPGSWEMPGGHLGSLDPHDPNGPKETPEQALVRETLEETGAIIGRVAMFAYREIRNPESSRYPAVAYSPFYWAVANGTPGKPTEEGLVGETFTMRSLETLAEDGDIQPSELMIIRLGVKAARIALGSVE